MKIAVQTAIRVHHLRSSTGIGGVYRARSSRLVQCVVIVGSALTIEIGDRTLLADASFVVGAGEKVGLVGRNGTGQIVLHLGAGGGDGPAAPPPGQRPPPRLVRVPAPGPGAGRPRAWSRPASRTSSRPAASTSSTTPWARPARPWPTTPPTENIELFTDLQEQFQSNGGYEAESVMARLADGLGLRQELLLEDIDELSGGQRRRVDLMRVLFQEPDLMILDEPTNHLDRSAKRWLLDELARFPGALLVVSHDLKLLDRSITKVLHIANQRLTEWKGNYSKFLALREADQSQRERAAELEQREIKRLSSLADSMRASTEKRARKAKALDRRVERMEATRTQVDKRERASSFKLPTPPRSGAIPLEVAKLGVRYGEQRGALRGHLPRRPGRPHRDHRAQRRREVLTAALPGRRAGTDERRGRAGGERGGGLLRAGARADRPDPQRAGQRERRRA